MNILNILSYKVLDNNVRRAEEHQILSSLKEARISEKILSAAMVHGENVQDDLEQTKSQIKDLTNRVPRGDNLSFYAFCILCIICIPISVYIYRRLQPIIMKMSGSLDNWSFQILQAGCFVTSSIWFTVLAVLLLILLWRIQKRLQYSHARRLITIITILGAITVLTFTVELLRNLVFQFNPLTNS